MSNKLASFISYVLHPGFMPTYLLGILYFLSPYIVGIDGYTPRSKSVLLAFVFAYTFLFPTLLVFWLYKRKVVSSMKLEKLSDRRYPYMFSVVCSGFLAYFFYNKGGLLAPSAIIIGYITLVIIVVAVISIWWKISAHAAGIAGVLGTLFMLKIRFDEAALVLPFFIVLVLTGLVVSARLKLDSHSSAQTSFGFAVGLLISIFGSLFI